MTAPRWARVGVPVALAAAVLTAGCTGNPPPAADPVTAADLEGLREDVRSLEERVADLEAGAEASDQPEPTPTDPSAGPPAPTGTPGASLDPQPGDDSLEFFADPASLTGESVTVTGVVTGALTTAPVGGAFRISRGTGDPVLAVTATPPPPLDAGDAVQVTGTAVEVRPSTFETDFGIAADALFADPDEFFAGAAGDTGLAVRRITVLPGDG